MDSPSLNHYEEQLYSMFKSFDVNNEEALDESAVHDLCDALQLEERGAALVDTLFEKSAGRVTFARFRSGLLAVLGDEAPSASRPPDPPPEPEPTPGEPEAGSGELEPRFVFGSKRYGRRSRPAQPELGSPRAASASRLDASRGARARPRARRSASAMETRGEGSDAPALEHDTRINSEEALALCRDLRMHAIDRRIVERIFEDAPGRDTTVGEFFERLDSTLAHTVSGVSDGDPLEVDEDARLPAERLVEEWERAGVRRPRRLLASLGLAAAAPRVASLERALDAELRALGEEGEARAELLTAALALARARAAGTRRRAAAAEAERDKLRADVVEANARAALLAREVDESHARIEGELKESLRRAEARHAEEARAARAEAESSLERWNAERARLAAEVTRRSEAEARLSAEAETLRSAVAALEERAGRAEAALDAARVAGARQAERAAAAEAQARASEGRAGEAEAAAARVATLLRENRRLQDRVDEQAAALESGRAAPADSVPSNPAADANLSTELGALLTPDVSEECDVESDAAAAAAVVERGAQTDACAGDEERERLQDLVKELEAALEAMRGEYEACEEYWAGKQRAEREAHDAELRAGDARLADLLARVAAFERRLAPPAPPLHAIPEAAALEAQVAALEAEAAAAARAAQARLQRATDQLARAHRRLAALQRRRRAEPAPAPAPPPPPAPAPAPCPAPCARCRRLEAGAAAAGARAARAEGAARRLQARLVAADVLVKELYVENCQLARHPP